MNRLVEHLQLRRLIRLVLLVAGGLYLALSLEFASLKIADVVFNKGGGRAELKTSIIYNPGNIPHVLSVSSSGCIDSVKLNGNDLALQARLSLPSCNSDGIKASLNGLLLRGQNSLVIGVTKSDSQLPVIEVSTAFARGIFEPYSLVLVLLGALFLAEVLCLLRVNFQSILLLEVGYLLRAVYLSYTDFNQRTLDLFEGGGHLDYIKYIALHWIPPNAHAGWEYHQPPLYYYVAAIAQWLWQTVGGGDSFAELQVLAMFFSLAFLFFGLKTIGLFISSSFARCVAGMLLVCWPSGVIHSIRIGPDPLFYALYAAAFFYASRWFLQSKRSDLAIAVLLAMLCSLTRSNAVILNVTIGLLLVSAIFGKHNRPSLLDATLTLFALTFGTAISFFNKIISAEHGSDGWLVGSVTENINSGLLVGNSLSNFLNFDLKTFVFTPFSSTWTDISGRQYFWNFLLKSSLFSEFNFSPSMQVFTAQALSLVFLLLLAASILFGIRSARTFSLRSLPLVLSGIVSLTALAIYRYKIPAASNNDFRYIFPVIIPLVIYIGRSVEVSRMVATLALGFAILGVVFFVVPII